MSIISFASCTNDIENLDIIPTNNGQNTEGNIILQERNPNLPLPLIKKFILNKPQTRNSVSGEDRTFLGYSYKIKNGDYIQGSINSLGFPIIDIDSIRKYRPSYLQEKLITVTETIIISTNTCMIQDLAKRYHLSLLSILKFSQQKKRKQSQSYSVI